MHLPRAINKKDLQRSFKWKTHVLHSTKPVSNSQADDCADTIIFYMNVGYYFRTVTGIYVKITKDGHYETGKFENPINPTRYIQHDTVLTSRATFITKSSGKKENLIDTYTMLISEYGLEFIKDYKNTISSTFGISISKFNIVDNFVK